jgi:hypothetical protein
MFTVLAVEIYLGRWMFFNEFMFGSAEEVRVYWLYCCCYCKICMYWSLLIYDLSTFSRVLD